MIIPKKELVKQLMRSLNKNMRDVLLNDIPENHLYTRAQIMGAWQIRAPKVVAKDDCFMINIFFEKEKGEVKA